MKKEDGDCRMQGCGRQGQQYGFDMTLRKAGIIDCEELYQMQLKCFRELLEKYRDYDFSPGAEKIENDGNEGCGNNFQIIILSVLEKPISVR